MCECDVRGSLTSCIVYHANISALMVNGDRMVNRETEKICQSVHMFGSLDYGITCHWVYVVKKKKKQLNIEIVLIDSIVKYYFVAWPIGWTVWLLVLMLLGIVSG